MSDGFFIADLDESVASGDKVVVTGSEAHHMAAVRRIATDERVTLTNGRGLGVIGDVRAIGKDKVSIEIAEVLHAPVAQPEVTIIQALPKQDRGELAVDLMTEVGVDHIVPWSASRSQVRWSGERGEKAHGKWVAAAREASKQARRFWIPEITDCVSTQDAVRIANESDLLLVMHEKATIPISECSVADHGRVTIVIGPEGGLTNDEVAAFETIGGKTYLMGPTVLRTSTAGAVAVTQVRLLAKIGGSTRL